MQDFHLALAAPGQPEPALAHFEALVQSIVGARLFTIMMMDRVRGVAWRAYSNQPQAYPSHGEKPFMINAWSQIVEEKQQTFVANTLEEIAEVFGDASLIASLGCESCINVPIIVNAQVIGTLNCLHEAGYYTSEKVQAAETLKGPGATLLLLLNKMGPTK